MERMLNLTDFFVVEIRHCVHVQLPGNLSRLIGASWLGWLRAEWPSSTKPLTRRQR
jgi:hypothetical protein